jgi:hypothetical protein
MLTTAAGFLWQYTVITAETNGLSGNADAKRKTRDSI